MKVCGGRAQIISSRFHPLSSELQARAKFELFFQNLAMSQYLTAWRKSLSCNLWRLKCGAACAPERHPLAAWEEGAPPHCSTLWRGCAEKSPAHGDAQKHKYGRRAQTQTVCVSKEHSSLKIMYVTHTPKKHMFTVPQYMKCKTLQLLRNCPISNVCQVGRSGRYSVPTR